VNTHDELMQLRIQRTRKLGARPMSIHINILEAELESTRKKIAEQLSMVGRSIIKEQSIDPTLY
jgi:predicted DNA-binding protein (UPF0251 family)